MSHESGRPDQAGAAASPWYDELETREPARREDALLGALPGLLAHASANAPGWAAILAGIDPREVNSRRALARLPVTRKSALQALQSARPPLGGLNATPVAGLARVFASPGPLYEAQGHGPDWWRTARALHAAGFRRGELVSNTFAYHLTPAGAIYESGALACGCVVLPAGTGQTETQVATLAHLGVEGYIGTPSFLRLIVEKADEMKTGLPRLRKAMVAAEYLPPALRRTLGERGIAVMQSYATADLGLVAYETRGPDGELCEGMIVDEGILLELVAPGTGDPVAPGEIGEVVVTTFNRDLPLIRFALGDLSAVLPGPSPCGRTNLRIKGWLGRADQSVKVRGLFVHPSQIGDLQRRHPEVRRTRLVVDQSAGQDRIVLRCEAESAAAGLAEALTASFREITRLRTEVAFCAPGELPSDGRVIEDARRYE